MRYKIDDRFRWFKYLIFASMALSLIIDLFTYRFLSRPAEAILFATSIGGALFHLAYLGKNYIELQDGRLKIVRWGVKLAVPYEHIRGVYIDGREIELTVRERSGWLRRLGRKQRQKYWHNFKVSDVDGFVAALRTRLPAEQLRVRAKGHAPVLEPAPTLTAAELPAAFPQRASAYLIDSLLIAILWVTAIVIATVLAIGADGDGEASGLTVDIALFAGPPLWFLYQWACNSKGTSVGKKIASLSIRPSHGRTTPGIGSGAVRTLGQAFGALPLGLGFWWAIWDGRKQAWHDKIAGTRVVHLVETPAPAEQPTMSVSGS